MLRHIKIKINGSEVRVQADITVAAAIMNVRGLIPMRRSVGGEPRTAFCGMGGCRECEVRINGIARRACMESVADGMQIETEQAI